MDGPSPRSTGLIRQISPISTERLTEEVWLAHALKKLHVWNFSCILAHCSSAISYVNFMPVFTEERRTHPSINERVDCIRQIKEKHTKELNVSRHHCDKTKATENDDHPKRYPAHHEGEDDCGSVETC